MDESMKAMEAPKKIYLTQLMLFATPTISSSDNDVEYIRTDAFIKKAEKFFTEKFEVEDYNDNIDIDASPIFNYGRFIDDFKNYMKGE